MMKTIKWGIIAPGKIAHKFASDLLLINDAEIVAVASRNIDRATEFAQQYSIEKAYGSYTELANDPKVDVVYIASPHTRHFEHSMLCLENGKHVLCEKPIAMNSNQLEELSTCARKNNRFLMEAFWTRFIPSYNKCRQLIENNVIGDIKYIQADFAFISPFEPEKRIYNKALGGGSLLDIGIYPVFIALDLLGKPEQILSSAFFSDSGVDESCNIIFNYPNQKASANLYSSILTESPIEALICGTKGEIKIESRWHHAQKITVTHARESAKVLEFELKGNGYFYEIEEVNNCLRNSKTKSELFSLKQSFLLHQTLDTIRSQIGLKYDADI